MAAPSERIIKRRVVLPDGRTVTILGARAATGPSGRARIVGQRLALPDDSAPLSAPLNVAVTAGNGNLAVTWDPPADLGPEPLIGYVVTAAVAGVVVQSAVVAPTARAATLANLTNDLEHSVTVAGRTATTTGPSVPVLATPVAAATVPGTPVATATAGNTTGQIDWTAPSDGGSPITGYVVRRGVQTPIVLAATARAKLYEGLTNGTTYTLGVKARNALGDGQEATVTVTPAAAVSLHAGHKIGKTIVTFTASNRYRPVDDEQDKIICLNAAGTRIRTFDGKREYNSSRPTLANLRALSAPAGSKFGALGVKFFYTAAEAAASQVTGAAEGQVSWAEFQYGTYDDEIQVVRGWAKNELTDSQPRALNVHHEPMGNQRSGLSFAQGMAEWCSMNIYWSNKLAGWNKNHSTGVWTYTAADDVSDKLAFNAIYNGFPFIKPADATDGPVAYRAALNNEWFATAKANRHLTSVDCYEDLAAQYQDPADTTYDDIGYDPPQPQFGSAVKMQRFIDWCRTRPTGLVRGTMSTVAGPGAIGFGEMGACTATGIREQTRILRENTDICTYTVHFLSKANSDWYWAAVPASYPITDPGVTLRRYPPRRDTGGTWASEQRMIAIKEQLDEFQGITDANRAGPNTQWTAWP